MRDPSNAQILEETRLVFCSATSNNGRSWRARCYIRVATARTEHETASGPQEIQKKTLRIASAEVSLRHKIFPTEIYLHL